MRVIAGSARRLQLETVEGIAVRPTTDRTKESMFNRIHNEVPGSKILDLFAGSGALGIEALSRGAMKCYFIDLSKEAVNSIEKNLNHTKLVEKAEVLKYDYKKALGYFKEQNLQFDIVFLDPPYNKGLQQEALVMLSELGLLAENAIIVVEDAIDEQVDLSFDATLSVEKIMEYRTNKFRFIRKG